MVLYKKENIADGGIQLQRRHSEESMIFPIDPILD